MPNGDIVRDDRKNSNGSIDRYGYKIIKIKGKQFKAHRVCWLLNYGDFPKCELDHIDRNKTNNRIENLRESNRAQQNLNKAQIPNQTTGVVGVHIDKTRGLKKKYAWCADGRQYRFYTAEEAAMFREEYRRKKYNEYL